MFTNMLPIKVMSFFGMLVGENTLEKWKKKLIIASKFFSCVG